MSDQQPVPSRMALQTYKGKRKGAKQGYDLLKKKSDALTARMRVMEKELAEVKKRMQEELKASSFALAKACWAAGDFRSQVVESAKRPAVTLKLVSENVAGVKLPVFSVSTDTSVDASGNIGVASGGQVIQTAKEKYSTALHSLVRLASLQTSYKTIMEEITMTNRRVNALDNVVIPKLDHAISYISRELDEMDREEFFRLKKVQEKKKQKKQNELDQLGEEEENFQAASIFDDTNSDVIF